jgi:hypothetical protein
MARPGKPKKVNAKARRPLLRKSPEDLVGKVKVTDLEKRLAEALKLKTEGLKQLQTRGLMLHHPGTPDQQREGRLDG